MHTQQCTREGQQHHPGGRALLLGFLIAVLSAAPHVCRPPASRTGHPAERAVLQSKDV